MFLNPSWPFITRIIKFSKGDIYFIEKLGIFYILLENLFLTEKIIFSRCTAQSADRRMELCCTIVRVEIRRSGPAWQHGIQSRVFFRHRTYFWRPSRHSPILKSAFLIDSHFSVLFYYRLILIDSSRYYAWPVVVKIKSDFWLMHLRLC